MSVYYTTIDCGDLGECSGKIEYDYSPAEPDVDADESLTITSVLLWDFGGPGMHLEVLARLTTSGALEALEEEALRDVHEEIESRPYERAEHDRQVEKDRKLGEREGRICK